MTAQFGLKVQSHRRRLTPRNLDRISEDRAERDAGQFHLSCRAFRVGLDVTIEPLQSESLMLPNPWESLLQIRAEQVDIPENFGLGQSICNEQRLHDEHTGGRAGTLAEFDCQVRGQVQVAERLLQITHKLGGFSGIHLNAEVEAEAKPGTDSQFGD